MEINIEEIRESFSNNKKDECIALFKKDFDNKLNSTIEIYLDEATKYCNLTKDPSFPLLLIPQKLYNEYNDAMKRYEDKTCFFIKILSYGLISDVLKNMYLEIEDIYYQYLKIVSGASSTEWNTETIKFNLTDDPASVNQMALWFWTSSGNTISLKNTVPPLPSVNA